MIRTSALPLAVVLALMGGTARADGEKTYDSVCSACHASGVAGAPKVGERKVWGPLIKEGQAILTAHGYVGVRAMPPKGGKPDLSLEDFASALVVMVNRSGGNWTTPDDKRLQAIRAEIVKREKELAAKGAGK